MSGFSNPIVGGMSKLIRAAIQSPNYVPTNTGWSINKDGSAEFNNLSIRGTFTGTNYVINSQGEFWYYGVPAANNLQASVTNVTGTDAQGNAFLQGITAYSQLRGGAYFATNLNQGNWQTYSGADQTAWTLDSTFTNLGLGGFTLVAANAGGFGRDVGLGTGTQSNRLVVTSDSGAPTWIYGNQPGQPTNTDEVWHDMRPLAGGFVGTIAGEYPPQYRVGADGWVEVHGTVQLPSSGSYNGVNFFTFPPGYTGSHASSWAVAPTGMTGAPVATNWNGFPRAFVGSAGGLQLNGLYSGANSTNIRITGRYPLDSTGLILT